MKRILVCLGCCCPAKGGTVLYRELKIREAANPNLSVGSLGCVGPCAQGPNVVVDGKLIMGVQRDDVERLIGEE